MDENDLVKKINKMDVSPELFLKAKTKTEESYKKIKETYCPYFKGNIVFNTKGLEHMKFKSWKKARTRKEQYMRFKMFSLVRTALQQTATLQGISTVHNYTRKKRYGNWDEVLNKTSFYEFVYVHNEAVRIKIIVRKDGNGPLYFYSVIPFWKMDKNGRKNLSGGGNPETD